jgi:hypothetical protein
VIQTFHCSTGMNSCHCSVLRAYIYPHPHTPTPHNPFNPLSCLKKGLVVTSCGCRVVCVLKTKQGTRHGKKCHSDGISSYLCIKFALLLPKVMVVINTKHIRKDISCFALINCFIFLPIRYVHRACGV